MTDWEAVGARVRELRNGLGLTQSQLGLRVGTSNTDVSQLESGIAVSEEKLGRYALALGASVAYLRYGVVQDADGVALWRQGYGAGWRAAISRVREGILQFREPEFRPDDDMIPVADHPLSEADVQAAEEAAATKRSGRKSRRGGSESA